jgi:hypothetical protein
VLIVICDAAPCVHEERTPDDQTGGIAGGSAMNIPQPNIGDWYRSAADGLFEVVAYDEDDGTIEIQYFDGTIEEMERDDWNAQWKDGTLEAGEAPEDWSGSVDVDPPEEDTGSDTGFGERGLHASPLEGIERFR